MKKIIFTLALSLLLSTTAFAAQPAAMPNLILERWDWTDMPGTNRDLFHVGGRKNGTEISKSSIDGLLMINGIFSQKYFPINQNGTNIVPIRAISENLGIDIKWIEAERKVEITGEGINIEMTIDDKTALVNGQPTTMLAAPQIVNDLTHVPLRFVAEAFGMEVGFDKELLKFPIVWVTEKRSEADIVISAEEAYDKIITTIKSHKDYSYHRSRNGVFAVDITKMLESDGDIFEMFWLVDTTSSFKASRDIQYLVDKYTGMIFVNVYAGVFGDSHVYAVHVAD